VKRAVLCAALVAMSCESAAKHPGITIGAVTGTMGFGLCSLSVSATGTCAIVGGAAALALGGITALVTLIADTNASEPDPYLDDKSHVYDYITAPPPGLPVDAGVDAAPVAPVPAFDAGTGAM
jgi:hypothetical protein